MAKTPEAERSKSRRARGNQRRGASADSAGGQSRRSEILEVAARIFAEHGFEATTIRQIGDAAGILSGSLYYHFTTKEEILHEIIRPYGERLVQSYREIACESGEILSIFTKMIRFSFEDLVQKRYLQIVFHKEMKFFRRVPEFNYVTRYSAEVVQIWYGILQEGVRAGVFREGLNMSFAARLILRIIAATAEGFDDQGQISPGELEEELLKVILYGTINHSGDIDSPS